MEINRIVDWLGFIERLLNNSGYHEATAGIRTAISSLKNIQEEVLPPQKKLPLKDGQKELLLT